MIKLSDKEIDKMAEDFGEILNKENKVTIKIPFDGKNPSDTTVPVGLNGYIYYIKRGQKVEVPETIANILEEAKYI